MLLVVFCNVNQDLTCLNQIFEEPVLLNNFVMEYLVHPSNLHWLYHLDYLISLDSLYQNICVEIWDHQ